MLSAFCPEARGGGFGLAGTCNTSKDRVTVGLPRPLQRLFTVGRFLCPAVLHSLPEGTRHMCWRRRCCWWRRCSWCRWRCPLRQCLHCALLRLGRGCADVHGAAPLCGQLAKACCHLGWIDCVQGHRAARHAAAGGRGAGRGASGVRVLGRRGWAPSKGRRRFVNLLPGAPLLVVLSDSRLIPSDMDVGRQLAPSLPPAHSWRSGSRSCWHCAASVGRSVDHISAGRAAVPSVPLCAGPHGSKPHC
mmetsp:Transcript_38484/g.107242  ORF Transcript_38484/g.107242 Transcript_38484/m.107242 type:complete len:246 (-) Transcript_38484:28-765(-)